MLAWVGDSDVIGAWGTPSPATVAIIDAASTSDFELEISKTTGLAWRKASLVPADYSFLGTASARAGTRSNTVSDDHFRVPELSRVYTSSVVARDIAPCSLIS